MYKVIFTDDEMIIRENVSKHVAWKKHGFDLVGSFSNGKEVLEYLSDHSVDLLITDISMPFMDGMELCEYIYKNYPDIKIVLLSGYDDFEYAKKAIRYHVVEYVLKPFTSVEMGELLDRIRAILDEEYNKKAEFDQLATTYRNNYQLIRSQCLSNLITGMNSLEDSRADLKQLDISFSYTCYCVAVLELNMFYNAETADSQNTQKESKLISYTIYNIANELITQTALGIACQDKDNHTLLLFYSDDPDVFMKKIHTVLTKIMHQLKKTMELKATIGVGSAVTDMDQLPLSYAQAKKAACQHYTKGENQIISFADIKDSQNDLSIKALIKHLVLAIKNKTEAEIEQSLSDIENTLIQNQFEKEKSSIYLCMGVEMIHDYVSGFDLDDLEEKNLAITNILHSQTLSDAIDNIRTYVLFCVSSMMDNYDKSGKNDVVLALDYIEQHYMDTDISLKTVCSYLNISTSRFSTLFKSIQKETFVDVLTRTRMSHAMELLVNTDLKNYEIAERVGFSDPHYFGIAFKKATGMTPTEYAKTKKQQGGPL